jgi:rod shape-determining protein MreC
MLKRPHYMTLGVVALLTLILLSLPGHTAARLKLAIGSLFLPLFGLANTTQQLESKAGDAVTPRRQLLKENESYRRENQRLQIEAQHAEEIQREFARLRTLVAWREQSPWKTRLRLANVVLRDPANWWRTAEIDLGSRDGMRADLPVLTADGLVGKISNVGLTRSQIVLLGDASCKVDAQIANEIGDTGVIAAADPVDNSLLTLEFLQKNANLKPGQSVATSGLGLVFPKGIPIGTIVDSRPVESGLYLEARVKVGVNLGALEEVWVLIQ